MNRYVSLLVTVIFILSIVTNVKGELTGIEPYCPQCTTTTRYSMISQTTYVILNNTYAVVVEKYQDNGTTITIYENGASINLYCSDINLTNTKYFPPPSNNPSGAGGSSVGTSQGSSNASTLIVNIHTMLSGENLPPIGIYVYKDYLIVEFSPNSTYSKFYVLNSNLVAINHFIIFRKNKLINEGMLGISGKYLLYYRGTVTYRNVTVYGNNTETESFLNLFGSSQYITIRSKNGILISVPVTLKNNTFLVATIPEISNITVYMYNMLNGNIDKQVYLGNLTINQYPSLILFRNVSIDYEPNSSGNQSHSEGNQGWLNLTFTKTLSDFIYDKVLDLETLCYDNLSMIHEKFYVISLWNGKDSSSPDFSLSDQITYGNNLIVVKNVTPNFPVLFFYSNIYLYAPNFSFLGNVSVSEPFLITISISSLNTPFTRFNPSTVSTIYSPYNPTSSCVYYNGYTYVNNGSGTFIFHGNQSIYLGGTTLFFFERPILIEGGAGTYKVMELNGSSILKCVDVEANNFTTWNTIVICRGETITQDQNYTKVTNFECLSRSGVGDFIVFSNVSEFETADHTGFSYNGTNVVVGLPKLIPINWTNSNLVGVYNTYPILLNDEILRPTGVYNITNNSINEYNISISVNSSSSSINYQLFIFPLLLATVVMGLLRLRKVL